jgi:hypothetical protein
MELELIVDKASLLTRNSLSCTRITRSQQTICHHIVAAVDITSSIGHVILEKRIVVEILVNVLTVVEWLHHRCHFFLSAFSVLICQLLEWNWESHSRPQAGESTKSKKSKKRKKSDMRS